MADALGDRIAALRLESVSKSYGDHRALVSLKLAVSPGEFLTLLGPSGSGKTTTLMIAAGFVRPTSGRVWLGNRDITDLPPHKRNVGVVFQNYALFPHRTVADNVAFPLRMRKVPTAEREQRVRDTLKLVQLEDYGSRFPRQLSGGQQQRVALARAIVFNPPILLMDEPLGALDKNLRTEMQIELKRLHEELGLTVVYVTHDQGEALSMSDRVAVMRDGLVEQLDSPTTLYGRPKSRFVASFVGDTNLLIGRHVADGTFEVDGCAPVPLDPDLRSADGGERALAVRAERARLSTDQPPRAGNVASLPATVVASVYQGDSWIVELRVGPQEMRAKWDDVTRPAPSRGEQVHVSWDVSDGLVLD